MVELVDTLDLGSSAVRCESSSLSACTNKKKADFNESAFLFLKIFICESSPEASGSPPVKVKSSSEMKGFFIDCLFRFQSTPQSPLYHLRSVLGFSGPGLFFCGEFRVWVGRE